MRLIIKPAEKNFNLIVEAEAYRQVWKTNARKLRRAFRKVTGLDFNQAVITAKVYDGDRSFSGYYRHPMRLEARGASHDEKLLVLVHELCHRLLGGNGLANNNSLKLTNRQEHDRMFLFEHDVVKLALGPKMADLLDKLENRPYDKDYYLAWKQAMAMGYEQRQKKMHELARIAKPYRDIKPK